MNSPPLLDFGKGKGELFTVHATPNDVTLFSNLGGETNGQIVD